MNKFLGLMKEFFEYRWDYFPITIGLVAVMTCDYLANKPPGKLFLFFMWFYIVSMAILKILKRKLERESV